MARSPFGWDLPPGVTHRMIDEQAGVGVICDCCGHAAEDCICPECQYCSDIGNPACYTTNHPYTMEFSDEQLLGQAKRRIDDLKQRIDDEKQALTHIEERIKARKRAEQRNADHIDGYDRDDLGESPDF